MSRDIVGLHAEAPARPTFGNQPREGLPDMAIHVQTPDRQDDTDGAPILSVLITGAGGNYTIHGQPQPITLDGLPRIDVETPANRGGVHRLTQGDLVLSQIINVHFYPS
ncbi:hypothetical protein IJ118_00190 [Candidatus Saccharibacteria bacterium]|nr:hypothetical protein [Candidatus Saccharibacteria bacterium]